MGRVENGLQYYIRENKRPEKQAARPYLNVKNYAKVTLFPEKKSN